MEIEELRIPEDIIEKATPEDWEELFDKYLIYKGNYVWKPDVMKDFIKNLLNKT